jgi:hypothetical protein
LNRLQGEDSPVRPPRRLKSEKEVSKKDLFFDLGGTLPAANKLKSSTSYSELARTSMLNSNYFKGHKNPPTAEASKGSDEWKRRSPFYESPFWLKGF